MIYEYKLLINVNFLIYRIQLKFIFSKHSFYLILNTIFHKLFTFIKQPPENFVYLNYLVLNFLILIVILSMIYYLIITYFLFIIELYLE